MSCIWINGMVSVILEEFKNCSKKFNELNYVVPCYSVNQYLHERVSHA